MITINIKPSQKLNDDFSAFVSFNYNEKIVQTIKHLPFRFYEPDTKQWEIPRDKVKELQNNLSEFQFNIIDIANVLELDDDNSLPSEFHFVTKPFDHQLSAIEYGMAHSSWFLGDEMGLGKTKTVIDIAVARKLKYGYKHCLIVCGVNTLKWNWVNEILTHSYEKPWILGQKETKNGKIKIGSTKDKVDDLRYLLKEESSTYFLITNIESFRDKEFTELIQKLCQKKIINMCAADEFHKMKNTTNQQSKGFMKCQPEYKIAMTGTPLMNNPIDLYGLLKWLGYESHPLGAFKSHYCIMGGFGGYEIVAYKNLDELQNKLQEIMVRRLKEDIFDLPEKLYVNEYVEMTPGQAKIYKEADSYIREHIDLIAADPNPLSALIRLRQATGYTGILSSEIRESAKLDRMEDLVEEAVSNNKKVVIFSNWTQMTDVIKSRLSQKYKGLMITGQTNDAERQVNVNHFQNNPECKYIIGTIGAMGTGLTLTAATVVIFVDHPWTRALYDQAVDRCHRIGQTNAITIYNLMCKDTIDERIYQIVLNKGRMSDMLVDGEVNGNKTELINYLLG